MKRLCLFLAATFLLCATSIKAQVAVFATYEDFTNKKYTSVDYSDATFDQYSADVRGLKKSKAWGHKEYWGVAFNNMLYRKISGDVAVYGSVARVYEVGEYILYYEYGVRSVGKEGTQVGFAHAYISKDLNSKVYMVDRRRIRDIAKKDPAFEKLAEYVEKADRKKDIKDLITEYITQSPSHKEIKDLIPVLPAGPSH